MKNDRIFGSLLGLALGDAFGAPYEGGILERAIWALVGTQDGKRRLRDDTQMTIDVIESLVECGRIDQNDLARRFAQSYRWSRGYRPRAARVLKRIRRGQSWESARRNTDASRRGGATRSSEEAPVMGVERRGCVIRSIWIGQPRSGMNR